MKFLIPALLISILFTGCLFSKNKKVKTPTKAQIQTTKVPKNIKITKNTNITQKALLVGVNDYKDKTYDLMGTQKDVRKINKLFSSWGFDIDELYGSKSLEFQDKLLNLANTLKSDDVLVIYFSGHGSFTKDYNGDEISDNRDEILVFSDGIQNLYMLDDTIDKILEKIKARKLIIIDSCYSGTVNRSYTPNAYNKVKFIPAPPNIGDFLDDGIAPTPSFLTAQVSGSTVLLSSCKDNEKSIATKEGSLFTNSLVKNLNLDKSFDTIHKETLNNVSKYFHPVLSASNPVLKNITIKEYLKINTN